ncbi:MAG: hypothetical protein ABW199_07065, partial [Caulobacterales bacterium]
MIEAWNKIDLLLPDQRTARLARAEEDAEAGAQTGNLPPIPLSALTGEGANALLTAIDRAAFGATRIVTFSLDAGDGRTRARIAASGRIVEEHVDDDGRLKITAELGIADAARLSLEANA